MYLETIESPADLRKLPPEALPGLAREIRELILDVVSRNGGHLGANLGTVELTLALHYVFDVPTDSLVFDVGHQAYTHKIVTGRREFFRTLRRFGGCAGFPHPAESHSCRLIDSRLHSLSAIESLVPHFLDLFSSHSCDRRDVRSFCLYFSLTPDFCL